MTLSIHDLTMPLLVNSLTDMKGWLDKAATSGKSEAALIDARLAADMKPLSAQYQFASDSAKNGMARLAGIEMPSMADTETSFAELKARCDKTIAFVQSITADQLADAATRDVTIKFPNGMGYSWPGQAYLTGFMLPNFFFHVTTAYAILRAQGVAIGKPDYLAHLGAPVQFEAEPA